MTFNLAELCTGWLLTFVAEVFTGYWKQSLNDVQCLALPLSLAECLTMESGPLLSRMFRTTQIGLVACSL